MAQNKALELSIKIAGKVDRSLITAINQTNTLTGNIASTLNKVGTAGLATISAMATATVAGLASCTKEAAKFENYMADVVKVVDGLADVNGKVTSELAENGKTFAENYSEMKETLKDLSTQIPYTFEDLTRLAAAAGQSGKTFEDLTKTDFLKDVAMWGTAMDISADQAGDWGAKWEQAFGMNHEQVMDLADVINYLGNSYATTAAEIAQSVNDAAAMGQIVGVDPTATAAMAASMQAMGVSSDRVGTTIARIYTNMSKGANATKAMKTMWQELGFTAEGIAKEMQPGGDSVGTLTKVFEAINNMPGERKMAALNTLFGQWAIEGGAKVTQNLELLTGMLEELQDENIWKGSMAKEFLVKAETPEAIEMMLGNSKKALMDDIGSAMLPAYKTLGLSLIDFIARIRKNMPQLEQMTGTLGELASRGVDKLADAMERALPYIQKGLGYLANNGGEAAAVLGKLAVVFAAMQAAPVAEGLLSGAGGLLFGGGYTGGKRNGGLLGKIKNLYHAGSGMPGKIGTGASALYNGALLGQQVAGSGAIGIMAVLQNWNGLFGGKRRDAQAANRNIINTVFGAAQSGLTAGGVLKNAAANSGIGRYVSSVLGGVKEQRAASARFAWSLGEGMRTLLSVLPGKKGSGIMGPNGFMSFNDAIFGTPLSGRVAVKNILGSGAGLLASGAGLLGKAWGPIAGGLGSAFAGAAPVVGVISAIIAAVSILTDNLDILAPVFTKVFGQEAGAAKLEAFRAGIAGVSETFFALANGGVETALAGLRDKLFGDGGVFAGNTDGMKAFDGLVTILQAVMTVAGQGVNFATGTVKPIMQDIFGFVTGTVVPILLQTFGEAAPYIAGIVSALGGGMVTGMQMLGGAIQAALPIVKAMIAALLSISSAVIPAVLAGMNVMATGVASILDGVKGFLTGLIEFIVGVFTADWGKAWDGVKQIFGGAFAALEGLVRTPINAVSAMVNKLFDTLRRVNIKIPEESPLFGGLELGFGWLPELPRFARGGFTSGPSIAGEAGTEAVISFQSAARAQNIATWKRAGRMLGVLDTLGNEVQLKHVDTGHGGGGGGNITFAPNIVIQGNADEAVLDEALRRAREEFETWYERMMRRRERVAY